MSCSRVTLHPDADTGTHTVGPFVSDGRSMIAVHVGDVPIIASDPAVLDRIATAFAEAAIKLRVAQEQGAGEVRT